MRSVRKRTDIHEEAISSIQTGALTKWLIGSLAMSSLLLGCSERENARLLRLDGLQEFVCAERPYVPSTNTCGNRSIWLEADSGLIAYVTIYGVESRWEAEQIAKFLTELKIKNQQNIRVSLTIYSDARNKGREPSNSKIFEKAL